MKVADELTVVGRAYVARVEPGLFDVMVGGASDNIHLHANFMLHHGVEIIKSDMILILNGNRSLFANRYFAHQWATQLTQTLDRLSLIV